ncbi:LRC72-like protein [Mya arenaria]|uniref:LRC72-like protein n=1 Tax=Mya arenaria TaxID=6604 RepID=A0ABY7DWA8_MYAAR|nr:LRC72-like protein [Mya arenaria]
MASSTQEPYGLRGISCLSGNFQIRELYLQNNELTDVSGSLRHLTCLEVLMLHNNQLTKLDRLVKERLKKSVTLYTTFDWSKLPRIEARRQTNIAFDSPEIITHNPL